MSCIVKDCKNYRTRRPPGISFHQFPRHVLLQNLWLEALGLKKDNFIWSPNKIVCSIHFSQDGFNQFYRKQMLKKNVVPNINLHGLKSHLANLPSKSAASQLEIQSTRTGMKNFINQHVLGYGQGKNTRSTEADSKYAELGGSINSSSSAESKRCASANPLKKRNTELRKHQEEYCKKIYSANQKIKLLEKHVTSLKKKLHMFYTSNDINPTKHFII